MAQVIKFASDIDGKVFETQAEQLAYDAAKRNEATITAFLDKHYPNAEGKKLSSARTIAAKVVALWLGELAGGVPAVAVEAHDE